MPLPLANTIRAELSSHAQPAVKAWHEAYMRHQFVFLGVAKPVLKSHFQKWKTDFEVAPTASEIKTLVQSLWKMPERELQYVAIMVLRYYQNALTMRDLAWIKTSLIKKRSWWDTIDELRLVVAAVAARHSRAFAVAESWANDPNLWVRRTAILIGPAAHLPLLLHAKIVALTKSDPDFFIQKAMGWSLREYAKQDVTAVVKIVADLTITGLARREALKHYRPNL